MTVSSYGTRRASMVNSELTAPINITSSPSPSSSPTISTSLSSSATKKTKRPSSSLSKRRLSSGLASRPTGIQLSHSVPMSAVGRARSSSSSVGIQLGPSLDDDDDGEIKGANGKKERGQAECEKCGKVYRHSTCLVKHRWEHTAHWKEASKLLLSKHQQVQLLEAAAILKAASSGSSLPDEKSFWPAAVSPPSSGLLGSHSLNINVLTSPRLYPSSSLVSESHLTAERDDEDEEDESMLGEDSPPRHEEDEDSTEESAHSTGDDLLAESMWDMDIEEDSRGSAVPVGGRSMSVLDERSRSVGEDSGYGSLGKDVVAGGLPAQPVLGFFPGRRA